MPSDLNMSRHRIFTGFVKKQAGRGSCYLATVSDLDLVALACIFPTYLFVSLAETKLFLTDKGYW